ncbi:MAG TPA: KTSC domain-containing protein [Ramlibacter sp.]
MLLILALWVVSLAPARAETVEVKYVGSTNLDNYECEVVTRSSLINRLCYNAAAGSVVVQLRETYYAYCNVPDHVVVDWFAAESMGRFYNQSIKSDAGDGRFACE